jgi:hypothetical protein
MVCETIKSIIQCRLAFSAPLKSSEVLGVNKRTEALLDAGGTA